MTATVVIEQITGSSPGTYHVRDSNPTASHSGTRYMTSDQYDSALNTYPIPVPTNNNGVSGSYWVTHLLHITQAPDNYIKNVRYYISDWSNSSWQDWSLGTSSKMHPGLYIGISSSSISNAKTFTQGFPSSQYVQATGVEGSFGYFISSNHTYYHGIAGAISGGMTLVDDFDSLDNAYMVHSGQVVGNSTGYSNCIVTQVLVGSGATAGNKTDKTATFVYTEA